MFFEYQRGYVNVITSTCQRHVPTFWFAISSDLDSPLAIPIIIKEHHG